MDNQFASKRYRAQYYPLFSVRFSMESRQEQRAFGELAPSRCLFACKRLDPGGGSWSTQLSHKQFGCIAVSAFRIPTRIRRFYAADRTRVLLFVGGSYWENPRFGHRHRFTRNVRQSI